MATLDKVQFNSNITLDFAHFEKKPKRSDL